MSAELCKIRPKHSGFTLLEVLIALGIFSLIGLAAYRMLDIVILSQSKVNNHEDKIRVLERTMHIVSADFGQLVNRPIRDNYGDPLTAISSNEENYLVEFTRQGWRNPLQLPRSQLQRVAYELGSAPANSAEQSQPDTGTHLLRHYWPVLDRPQDSEPQTQVLLRDVNDLQLMFLDHRGNWQSEWPTQSEIGEPSDDLPKAILFKVDSRTLGNIERIYQLGEFIPQSIKPADINVKADVSEQSSPFGDPPPDAEFDEDDFEDFDE